jgi:hypothetical protein
MQPIMPKNATFHPLPPEFRLETASRRVDSTRKRVEPTQHTTDNKHAAAEQAQSMHAAILAILAAISAKFTSQGCQVRPI